MDKFLRPGILDIDPDSTSAADDWDMWKTNFGAFLDAIDPSLSPDKLKLLRAHVSSRTFKRIKGAATYEEAMKFLESLFVKPTSSVYARYLLATHRQQSGETIDQFLGRLRTLAQDCSFEAATAEEVENLAIRDAFITGLASGPIRQRLLENLELNLEDAVKQARTLEMAQQHSENYRSEFFNSSAPALTQDKDSSDENDSDLKLTASAFKVNNNKRCYFCGGPFHPRSSCRAREADCAKCGKVGHFARACRSKFGTRSNYETNNKHKSAAILASVSSVSAAIVPVRLGRNAVDALVDTGSSKSFVRFEVAKDAGLQISPASGAITLASTTHAEIRGSCMADLTINGKEYKDVSLFILDALCTPLLLGHDFLKRHQTVSVDFGGDQPPLEVCGLVAMDINPPTLFGNLSSDCQPVQVKSRRYTEAEQKFITDEIERLTTEEIVIPSQSPWRAQIVVVQQGKKMRMAVDYSQTINRFTSLNAYPVPAIAETVEKISKYSHFSSIDLRSAYHQIPIRKEDRQYTAFEANGRLFEFTRIPFGVTNGVACFQQVLDEIIRNEALKDTFAYVDDITVCGNSQEEHDENLTRFLTVAKKYGLTINEGKSNYSQTSIATLGYIIGNHQIRPDPERMKPLLEMPIPQNQKAKQRTLGLLSHYSKWVQNFSEKVQPIVRDETFPMSSTAATALEKLKEEISRASLSAIDDKIPFVVETDASADAIAASLTQGGKPVAFFSRSLGKSEKHHSVIEREACAIVESLRKWRHFLLGRHFKLITDQQSVKFMLDRRNRGRVKNDKILRWRLEMTSFDFDISYRPGSRNTVADALSRAPCDLTANVLDAGGLRHLHESLCHPGVRRMWHLVRCRNLPFSLEDVRTVVRKCPSCAEIKPRFVQQNNTLIKATRPFERISIDFKGPLPTKSRNRYILTIVDEFSRFIFAFPTSDTSSESAIDCLLSLFSLFGMPDYIHSDRGAAFVSQRYCEFLRERGVATSYSSAYNPRGNGQCERYNGLLWRTVRLALHSRNLRIENWEVVLPDALHSLRTLLCTSTNETPHERFFKFPRKAAFGCALPSWMMANEQVLLRKPTVHSKYEPNMETVTLLHANPHYARVRHPNGREMTVSLRRIARPAERELNYKEETHDLDDEEDTLPNEENIPTVPNEENIPTLPNDEDIPMVSPQPPQLPDAVRRSERVRSKPTYLSDYEV